MAIPDLNAIPEDKRLELARAIHGKKDFNLPQLKYWNYEPCKQHEEITQGCQRCSVLFRKHQRVGIAWLHTIKKGLIADSVGTGKAQALDAQVLTPNGFISMGDLCLGDEVIDPEGDKSFISGIFPQGEQDLYKINFADGSSSESTLDHLWKVRGPKNPKSRINIPNTTGLIWKVENLETIKNNIGGSSYYKRSVPLIEKQIDLESSPLPVDPYLLGLLLGDGSFRTSSITYSTADDELRQHCENSLTADLKMKLWADHGNCKSYGLVKRIKGVGNKKNSLQEHIIRLNLMGTSSKTKFVPEIYKIAKYKDRLDILRGLLDTDGTPTSSGASFFTVSQNLANDVAWLGRSIGAKASVTKLKRSKIDDKGNKVKDYSGEYRVFLSVPKDIVLFRLRRKADYCNRLSKRTVDKRLPVKWIRSIEFSRRAEVQCISVSASSQLYITDDWTITHNTVQTAGLFAVEKEAGNLDIDNRALVVCRAPAIMQWNTELNRMLNQFNITVAAGARKDRIEHYLSAWDVCIIGQQMLLRDVEMILHFPVSTLIIDDVDALRNRNNKTAWAIKKVAAQCDRVAIMTGTPLQKRLHELHSVLEPIGGREIFGSEHSFKRRYVRTERVTLWIGRDRRNVEKIVGYKNISEFSKLVQSIALRRTASDIDDVNLPTVNPVNIWLEFSPAQKKKYDELKKGVIRIVKEEGTKLKHAKAMAQVHYGAQICTGLAALGEPDKPNTSCKLDWLEDKLVEGDLSDEKVVVFMQYKNSIRAMAARLDKAGVGYEIIWGEEPNKEVREKSRQRFWNDPKCKVLMGTTSIEQSLNVQVARHLINVDTILNPARMEQLSGRIRRDGSVHNNVYIHNLLVRGSQEERYIPMLEREQALIDSVWKEQSELFAPLDAIALATLITG